MSARLLGEINERCKILNDFVVRIANRADEERAPELAPVLAAVKNFRATAGTTFELGFGSPQGFGIRTVRHQKIEAFAEHFFPAVPG
jgi:hypothetical protein